MTWVQSTKIRSLGYDEDSPFPIGTLKHPAIGEIVDEVFGDIAGEVIVDAIEGEGEVEGHQEQYHLPNYHHSSVYDYELSKIQYKK